MPTSNQEIASVLKGLIETCRNGQEGFKTAADAVQNDSRLKSFLTSCSEQRGRFVNELQNELKQYGGGPKGLQYESQMGTIAGSIHRGWIHLKGAIVSGDLHAILAECERGEDVALADYKKALQGNLPPSTHALISRQNQEISVIHNSVREARDSRKPSNRPAHVMASIENHTNDLKRSAEGAFERSKDVAAGVWKDGVEYSRENMTPILIGAFGLGFLCALAIRHHHYKKEERRPSRRIAKAVDSAGEKLDFRPLILPFLWPIWKALRGHYADSSKKFRKAYGKTSGALREALESKAKDFEGYIRPGVKKMRRFF